MNKKIRQQIYDKYNGHCAYCGNPIQYKDMQIDHVIPQRQANSTDDINNLLPTCRTCNHYKRGYTLYQFKEWLLGGLIERIKKIYIVKVAERYGMITFNQWNKKFYYEDYDRKKQE
jgi:hypothetical protein